MKLLPKAMFQEIVTDLLNNGYNVRFNAPGHSMYPTILANEPVLVEPINPIEIHKGDIILYRSNGSLIAHRVMGILRDNAVNEYFTLIEAFSSDPDQIETKPLCKTDSTIAAQDSKRSDSTDKLFFILRGDASRTFDEPVKCDQVIGKVISIERNGCGINPYGFQHKLACWLFKIFYRIKAFLGLALTQQKT
jgi:signal peptidase I